MGLAEALREFPPEGATGEFAEDRKRLVEEARNLRGWPQSHVAPWAEFAARRRKLRRERDRYREALERIADECDLGIKPGVEWKRQVRRMRGIATDALAGDEGAT